jgi:hypothetical protein
MLAILRIEFIFGSLPQNDVWRFGMPIAGVKRKVNSSTRDPKNQNILFQNIGSSAFRAAYSSC